MTYYLSTTSSTHATNSSYNISQPTSAEGQMSYER